MPIKDRKKINSLRADLLLVERAFARSRSHASELIRAGRVSQLGQKVTKPSQLLPIDAEIVVAKASEYVSRSGAKLAGALSSFSRIEIAGKVCLDVGASTGGFTQVLLEAGAKKVIAIDVGHSQLDQGLTDDPRVINLERINARELSLAKLRTLSGLANLEIDIVVADLSFISLTLVLGALVETAPRAEMVLLIKPQFEVGKQSLSASGVVSDPKLRARAIEQVVEYCKDLGLKVLGLERSVLPGSHGNIEYLIWIASLEQPNQPIWTGDIAELAREKR